MDFTPAIGGSYRTPTRLSRGKKGKNVGNTKGSNKKVTED